MRTTRKALTSTRRCAVHYLFLLFASQELEDQHSAGYGGNNVENSLLEPPFFAAFLQVSRCMRFSTRLDNHHLYFESGLESLGGKGS
jgi:hypothetical protein